MCQRNHGNEGADKAPFPVHFRTKTGSRADCSRVFQSYKEGVGEVLFTYNIDKYEHTGGEGYLLFRNISFQGNNYSRIVYFTLAIFSQATGLKPIKAKALEKEFEVERS
jgi:hypothetical protein